MPSLGNRLFDAVDRLAQRADQLLDHVRKTPRRRLDEVPEPIEPPDPFTQPAEPAAGTAPAEKPLGDPSIPAQVYGRRTDDRSGRALRALRDRGIDARFVDLDDPDHLLLEKQLIRDTKRYAMPWIYVRGEHVGGWDEVEQLAREGKLDAG